MLLCALEDAEEEADEDAAEEAAEDAAEEEEAGTSEEAEDDAEDEDALALLALFCSSVRLEEALLEATEEAPVSGLEDEATGWDEVPPQAARRTAVMPQISKRARERSGLFMDGSPLLKRFS